MKNPFKAIKQWIAETPTVRFVLAIGKLIIALASLYIAVGALVYPDWWRLFLWGGGFLDSRVWTLGFLTVEQPFAQFWPFGLLLSSALIACLCWLVFQYGRQGEKFMKAVVGPNSPPKIIWLGSVTLCLLICLGLLPRKPSGFDSFWEAIEMERWSKDMTSKLKGTFAEPSRSPYAPPSDGIYLYLNEELITRQFRALMPPLGIKGTVEKSSSGTQATIGIGVGENSTISAAASKSKEFEISKEAPQVSAPFAAQQLIARLAKSDDVVKISPGTGLISAQASHLTNQLEKLGVRLTAEQLQKLEAGDRANYKKETLKIEQAKVIILWGSVDVSNTLDGIILKFELDGPVKLIGTGIFKNDGLGDHLSLGLRNAKRSVHLSSVCLYGVIESREQDSESVRIVITPYALW